MAPGKVVKKSDKAGKPLGNKKDSRSRVSKSSVKRPPPKEQKTKAPAAPARKKRRVYTDEELGIPRLNMITPIGVQKPRGKKKGKVFVDDPESMMTIMAMVNAEKEGQIESKMMKARQMEEIRELRRQEHEMREAQRKDKLEHTKDSLRKKRHRKVAEPSADVVETKGISKTARGAKKGKRVSFG